MDEQRLTLFTIVEDLGDGSSAVFKYLSEACKWENINCMNSDYMQDEGSRIIKYKGAIDTDSLVTSSPSLKLTFEHDINNYLNFIKDYKILGKTWEEADDSWTNINNKKGYPYNRYVNTIKRHVLDSEQDNISASGINHFRTFAAFAIDTKMWLASEHAVNLGILTDIIEAYDKFDIDLFFELGVQFAEMLENYTNLHYLEDYYNPGKLKTNPKSSLIVQDLQTLNNLRDLGKFIPFMHELKLRQTYRDLYNSF